MYYESIADFEGPRAKCLSFHPTKPILLSSHHTSHINAYDLHLASHVHTFLGHDGPVRAVLFHPRTDLFVSGGDDCKIILWSYAQKKIVCTFSGHRDYIRSLDFHPTQPWIVSSSDDQTIRIWNFQSQKLLASVSGHSHYVMCVRFIGDVIISCSLDQTLRVWDYSSLTLRKENSLFGVPNVIVKQIIEGHDRGINHIVTHEDKKKFLTCGDDRQVKMWELDGSAWEKEAFYNHQGNVSGACFIKDNIISVGEDGVICLGDKRDKFDTRFWCVAKNKDETLLAFGHDSGIKLFSTVPRGLVYSYDGKGVYYQTEDVLLYNNLEMEKELMKVKKSITDINSLLVKEEGKYKNCYLIQEKNRFEVFKNKESLYKGIGKGLLLNNHIIEMNKNEIKIGEEVLFTAEGVKALIYYNTDSFFVLKGKGVETYNVPERKIKTSIVINDVEKIRVGKTLLAFIGKRRISLLDKKLRVINMIDEMVEITDGFFLEDVFFYSTMRHIKFTFNAYTGILRSIEKEVYLLFLEGTFIYYITKEGLENVNVDLTEYNLELAINKGNTDEINSIINKGVIPVEVIVDRLIKNNLSDFALPFIKEKKGDFLFEINKLEDCFDNIKDNKDNQMFERLFEKSMKMKNYDIAENCLKKLEDYQRLLMLYACRNQKEKIAEMKNVPDSNVQLNIAVILNDTNLVVEILKGDKTKRINVEKRNILKKTEEKFESLSISSREKDIKVKEKNNSVILQGNVQNLNDERNRCNNTEEKSFNDEEKKEKMYDEKVFDSEEKSFNSDEKNFNADEKNFNADEKNFNADKKNFNVEEKNFNVEEKNFNVEGSFNGEESFNGDEKSLDEISFGNEIKNEDYKIKEDSKVINVEQLDIHVNPENDLIQESLIVSEEQDTESYEKNSFELNSASNENIIESENSPTCSVNHSSEEIFFIRDNINFNYVNEEMDYNKAFEEVISNTTAGKFTSALNICNEIIHNIAYQIYTPDEYTDLRRNLGIYISGLSTEKLKKKISDPMIFLRMSSYFPSLSLQPVHKTLALSNFMVLCYKNENYNQAKEIAKEILNIKNDAFEKNANKILRSTKSGDKYPVKEGVYCFDVSDYCSIYKTCRFCYVNSEQGDVCSVCGVGVLN